MAALSSRSIAIVGGGLGGLCTAFFLRKSNPNLTIHLFEGSSRTGGWLQSSRYDDGAVFEFGPRSVRGNAANSLLLLSVVKDLGLTNELLFAKMENLKRFLYLEGEGLCELKPFSTFSEPPFTKPLWQYALSHLFTYPPDKQSNDCSVYEFFKNRMGEEVAGILIDAMVRGIFAGDARNLSMKAAFPTIVDMEKNSRNFLLATLKSLPSSWMSKSKKSRGQSQASEMGQENITIWGLRGGMETLSDALKNHLINHDVFIHLNSPVTAVVRNHNANNLQIVYSSDTEKSSHIFVDQVALATSISSVNQLLSQWRENTLSDEEIKSALSTLSLTPFATVAVASLEYPQKLPLLSQGFGHLIPSTRTSQPHILGVVYDSCVFPQLDAPLNGGRSRFTVMLGGAWYESHCATLSPTQITQLAHETVIQQCRFKVPVLVGPWRSEVRIQQHCIPQYRLGHTQIVSVLHKALKNESIWLVGSSFDGVSVNDVASSAYKAVDSMNSALQ